MNGALSLTLRDLAVALRRIETTAEQPARSQAISPRPAASGKEES